MPAWHAVLAVAVLGMSAWPAASAPSPASASSLTRCHVPGARHELLCGQLRRPLDPLRPDGPQVDIHYVVAPAMARSKQPDPVFLLAGGPGQAAISLVPQVLPLMSRLNNRRDIVFVDQRGTGRSAPLKCADADPQRLSDQADPAWQLRRLSACREALQALPHVGGADGLKFFTTTVAMQDLDAVRRSLGAERINLVGASYGTRAALEYQRQFPAAVRRSVLDGVAPPDMVLPASMSMDAQAVLEALLSACAREADCAAAHPRLRSDWTALLASLPRQAVVADPLTGEPERVTLTRELLLTAVRGALYAPALASALPQAIDAAARGRFDGLLGLGSLLFSRKEQAPAMGMHFSVVCAEDVPRLGRGGSLDGAGVDFGDGQARLYQQVCAGWPRGEVPEAFYALPTSATPVLLLSGGLDPATPPRHGDRVAQALGPQARHVVVDNAGHGVMAMGCMPEVLFRFIDAVDPASALGVNAACAKGIPRPPAFRPVSMPLRKDTPR
jgi:pimeloyl-ACP methyl ester carboxylesterase